MSAETEAPVAPASTPAGPCKQLEEAVNHLMQGKRHLLVNDYSSAVTSLADACSLIAGKYGDLAPECGDPYFFYGKALLELARAEAGVIEMNAPKSDSDEEEDEDKDDDSKDGDKDGTEEESKEDSDEGSKNSDDVSKNSDGSKNDDDGSKNDDDGSKNDDDGSKNDDEVSKNGEAVENGENVENGPGTSKGDEGEETCEGDENGDENDVNNLQLAWEVLEMAKIIYQKQVDAATPTKEAKIRLTEVLLKLGEVGIESENWSTAIEDLEACLAMQKQILEKDDRKLAETYYQLAVAFSNNNQYQESIDAFEKACAQLELRIETLETKRPQGDVIEKTVIDSEIKELKDLLVEMKDKLNDTKTEKDEPAPKDDQDDIVKNGSSKPASNIAHLVRKKPKAEPGTEAGASGSTSNIAHLVHKKPNAEVEKVVEEKALPSESTELKAENKTEEETKAEEKKRKPEEVDDADTSTLKKAKVDTES